MTPIPLTPACHSNDVQKTYAHASLCITTHARSVETRSPKNDIPPVKPPHLVSRAAADETLIPFWRTSLNQAIREIFSQSLGRLAGAAAFTQMSHMGGNKAASDFAAILGALSAGICSAQLLRHQIGSSTTAQKVGVGLVSVAAMAAGGVITGYASIPTVSMIASGSLISALASIAMRNTDLPETDVEPATESGSYRYPDENLALGIKITGFIAASTPFLIAFMVNPSFWLNHDPTVGTRNISIAIESLSIELSKAIVSNLGLSVNRDALLFEEKFKVAMMGLLPYVIASVLCNGVAGGLLHAELTSDQFKSLILPALVGTLANCVKGAANAAAARYVHQQKAESETNANSVIRPSQGLTWPISAQLAPKIMLRYLMISCRDSLFFGLKKAGLQPALANALSMMVYAGFAQFRDVTFDLMQGEGWSTASSPPSASEII
jgi:hypothetical protein